MIIDSPVKLTNAPPPPPYSRSSRRGVPPPPFSSLTRRAPTISDLPQHVLLQIVHSTCSPRLPLPEQYGALRWLATGLRLVSRGWYIACMHVLRSFYLPLYVSHIRAPYSSNPFPLSSPTPLPSPASASFPLDSSQRETAVLDTFIALTVRQDYLRDESELHLEPTDEGYRDLFEFMQPRARMEDLARRYLLKAGLTTLNTQPVSSRETAIPFSQLSVSFSTRKVGLLRVIGGRKRTLVEVSRDKDETLESVAKRLVKELANTMVQ